MEKLKRALSSVPALKPLVYTPEDDGLEGEILLGVDASGFGFGAGGSGEEAPPSEI